MEDWISLEDILISKEPNNKMHLKFYCDFTKIVVDEVKNIEDYVMVKESQDHQELGDCLIEEEPKTSSVVEENEQPSWEHTQMQAGQDLQSSPPVRRKRRSTQ